MHCQGASCSPPRSSLKQWPHSGPRCRQRARAAFPPETSSPGKGKPHSVSEHPGRLGHPTQPAASETLGWPVAHLAPGSYWEGPWLASNCSVGPFNSAQKALALLPLCLPSPTIHDSPPPPPPSPPSLSGPPSFPVPSHFSLPFPLLLSLLLFPPLPTTSSSSTPPLPHFTPPFLVPTPLSNPRLQSKSTKQDSVPNCSAQCCPLAALWLPLPCLSSLEGRLPRWCSEVSWLSGHIVFLVTAALVHRPLPPLPAPATVPH